MFVGVVCLVMAAIIAFVILPLSLNRSPKKTRVIRASRDIQKGQLIGKDDLVTAEVGLSGLPSEGINKAELAVGKYASVDLKKDDYLFLSKLSNDGFGPDGVFSSLNGEKYALSVTIDSFAAGLSGKLETGDIVRLVIYKDKIATMPPELAYLRVITTTTRSGIDKQELPEDSAASEKLPLTVTFLVNDIQASMLVDYENSSKIHIVLVYRGNEDAADQFIQEQDNFFEEKYGALAIAG